MSGKNITALALPPGINSDLSQYSAKGRWWRGNLVRWIDKTLVPIGGWIKRSTLTGDTNPYRVATSWRANDGVPYVAIGAADKVKIASVTGASFTWEDVTPGSLVWSAASSVGYGANEYGGGAFGVGSLDTFDETDQLWWFDQWGEDLLAVHSGDGRLFMWDKSTPTTDMAVIADAPIGNKLVIVTNERFAMVMGGSGHPRRVKWCSREDITLWTAADDNTAGGFELDTNGEIKSAVRVSGGILVFTDCDVHLIEYTGAPYYYSSRLITDVTGIIATYAFASVANGVIFCGSNDFWSYEGSNVVPVPCSIKNDIFVKGNLTRDSSIFMGLNEHVREIWMFYPHIDSVEADRYAIFKPGEEAWWANGELTRTGWLNPIWQSRPYMLNNIDFYEHERGWLDDGATRVGDIFIESGSIEIGDGDNSMHVDRIYQDTIEQEEEINEQVVPVPYTLTFKLQQSPQAPIVTYGPITPNGNNGYTAVRFRARQVAIQLDQTVDQAWGLGTTRMRVKARGLR